MATRTAKKKRKSPALTQLDILRGTLKLTQTTLELAICTASRLALLESELKPKITRWVPEGFRDDRPAHPNCRSVLLPLYETKGKPKRRKR